MLGATNILPPPKLDLALDRYAAFRAWKVRWTDYSVITSLNTKDKEYQCAMLRFCFTEDTQKIYESLNLTTDEVGEIIDAMEKFAKGIINETLERHLLRIRKQEQSEPFDDFLTDVKVLSKNCNFCATCHDGLVRDQIVEGVSDDSLRRKLLAEPNLTLKKAEDICRSKEKAQQGADKLKEERTTDINADAIMQGNKNWRGGRKFYRAPTKLPTENRKDQACRYCNRRHPRGAQNCPAWGKTCISCQKRNHFKGSEVCRSQIDNVEEEEEATEGLGSLFLGAVNSHGEALSWEIEIPTLKGGSINFKIDTGADVTVISSDDLQKLNLNKNSLKTTRKKLKGPANQPLKCLGYTYLDFRWGEEESKEIVYVCDNLTRALLGKPAINRLKVATLYPTQTVSCGQIKTLGDVEGDPIHIKLKKDATPYQVTTNQVTTP